MKSLTLSALSLAFTVSADAQTAVPITNEPHHHLVFSSDRLRTFRVEVAKGTSTLLHEHAVDYFWIGIGAAEFTNAVPGKTEVKVVSTDGSVHFTKGNFSHIARIDGPNTFRNVTLELPLAQTHQHNLCATVIADFPMDCAPAKQRAVAMYLGGNAVPQFETDQTRVVLLTIEPDAVLNFRQRGALPVFVAVEGAEGTVHTTCIDAAGAKTDALQPKSGDAFVVKAAACVVHNATSKAVRLLAVEFLPGGG